MLAGLRSRPQKAFFSRESASARYIGDLPLAALVDDQTPVRDFVQALHDKGRKPKTIRNHVQVVKAVVASARDPKSRKQLFPVAWDNDYIDCPVVGEQRTPSVVAQQMFLDRGAC
jgi:hypothetical protein